MRIRPAEKMARSFGDAPLLGRGDALRAGSPASGAPVSDLDENQRFPVPHDEVDFAAAGAVVTLQQVQPALRKEGFGGLFPVGAAFEPTFHGSGQGDGRVGGRNHRNRVGQGRRASPPELRPGRFALQHAALR